MLVLAFTLGMRHGVDPDHLVVIDGLSRLRPGRWNGVLFAIGHGLAVTTIAVGVGSFLADLLEPLSPWLLFSLGILNLWRLFFPDHSHPVKLVSTNPLLLGVLFAAGFETASQLSALALTSTINPWLIGAAFSLGMLVVDGIDGYLAARTQVTFSKLRSQWPSRCLGVVVVVFSFSIGGADLLGANWEGLSFPLGVGLFVLIIALRIWSRWSSNSEAKA
ncbi:MAG: hypothetical protein H7Y37_17325 [Anaerolineae bacterium]|nr:hypothetical protein [Gloeobacterales cyanobacterium ES-bin-313]